MTLKPLYLEYGREWRVRIDGPALRVDAEHRASAWYPLNRVSRVVSAIDTQWATDALLTCLRAGVPVQFMDGFGELQAYCYGARRRETTLAGLLNEAIEHPEWSDRFDLWRRALSAQMIAAALRCAGLAPAHELACSARSDLCNAHHLRLRRPVGCLLRHLAGATHAFVSQRLHEEISEPRLLGHPQPGLCFAATFADLMQWPAHALMRYATPALLEEYAPPRQAAILFEQGREMMAVELDTLLGRFELWLRDWVL